MNEEELFAALEEEMAVMPCESPQHSSSPMHEGEGEWYITYICPLCNVPYGTVLSCERYKDFLPVVLLTTGSSVLQCITCKEFHLYSATIISSEKRLL